jgi:hypothetical protein
MALALTPSSHVAIIFLEEALVAIGKSMEAMLQNMGLCVCDTKKVYPVEECSHAAFFSKQLWISKFSSGHCAVGKMTKIRKEWRHNKCPPSAQKTMK